MTLSSLWSVARARSRPVPAEHRRNFLHLYLDIAWFGVLNGSAMSFMVIYATRLGASGLQVGLLNAMPAVVSVLLTLPAGHWLQNRPLSRSVFWTSMLSRASYLLWIFLPLFLSPQAQVWALITLVLLMSIPGVALAVGFNAMFANAVPAEWRGHVVGWRNTLLAASFIATSLLCGIVLQRLPFPLGYQVVFGMGALGAAMSSYHLWFVRPAGEQTTRPANGQALGDMAQPGTVRAGNLGIRLFVGLRYLLRRPAEEGTSLSVWSTPFRRVLVLLFLFHLVQHLAVPLFPLYWVNVLDLTDGQISLGNALFYVAVLLGSMQLARLTARLGNQRLFALGLVIMSFYPLLTAMTRGLGLFLFTCVVGGIAWSQVGGAASNYVLERAPAENRPANLAWYNLALNTAVLIGSLAGPLLADFAGLVPILLVATAGRFFVSWLIWRYG